MYTRAKEHAMAEHVNNESFTGPQHVDRKSSYIAPARPRILSLSLPPNLNDPSFYLSEEDMDNMEESKMTDEDAQSLIGPSISHAATRLRSPNTPAVEKAAAMEELEGGGLFDSDAETPPLELELGLSEVVPEHDFLSHVDRPSHIKEKVVSQPERQNEGLSLGRLPSPKLEEPLIPTPWHAGPKSMLVDPADAKHQSALHGVFNSTQRNRSLSGGAEALRKLLPKGLPSMAQVGNLFGSSSNNQKPKSSSPFDTPKNPENARSFRSASSSVSGGSPQPQSGGFEPIIPSRAQTQPRQKIPAGAPPRPKNIRRVTSDDSLLYHSLSRASSLGDDTRFEKQQDQVNSRVKAIRDSLQDRSSFRMPQLPSMPSMPNFTHSPSFSFSFSMNFLNSTSSSVNVRLKPDTDGKPEILPGNIVRKRTPPTSKPIVAPAMIGAVVTRPEAAIENVLPVSEDLNLSALDRALESLTGDIIVMGGYRGSILRSTRTKRQLWVPVKVGLNIRKVNLEVGLEPEDEELMEEKIYASGMLQNIGPVDISKRLFKRLFECDNARTGKLRVWDYGYDWRLSPHLLARKLTEFLEKLPSNLPSQDGTPNPNPGAFVIAHSLGGLITRHVVNRRPELFSGVVYAGVPQACVNILGPLRNGDAVLLSSRVLTAQVNFTLRTSFVLLPEDGHCFIDINTKEYYPVDFFDVNEWIKYRWTPCLDPPFPPRNPQPSLGLGGILNLSKSGSLLSLPLAGKRPISSDFHTSASGHHNAVDYNPSDVPGSQSPPTKTTRLADTIRGADGGTDRTLAPQMEGGSNPVSKGQNTNQSVSTAVTIPRDKALAYLRRTLAETKKFKQELHFKPELSESNQYPPLALIYGKSIPTLFGAKVDGREGIPCSDSYDNLAFASGDGVCLAKQAMLPEGYKAVYGGRISSDRGHVTLLGDLNAVGRAIEAVLRGRAKGIGLGDLNAQNGINGKWRER